MTFPSAEANLGTLKAAKQRYLGKSFQKERHLVASAMILTPPKPRPGQTPRHPEKENIITQPKRLAGWDTSIASPQMVQSMHVLLPDTNGERVPLPLTIN